MERMQMIRTGMIKGLKILVNESRGSFVGLKNVQPLHLLYLSEKSFVCEWDRIPNVLAGKLRSKQAFGLYHL